MGSIISIIRDLFTYLDNNNIEIINRRRNSNTSIYPIVSKESVSDCTIVSDKSSSF